MNWNATNNKVKVTFTPRYRPLAKSEKNNIPVCHVQIKLQTFKVVDVIVHTCDNVRGYVSGLF